MSNKRFLSHLFVLFFSLVTLVGCAGLGDYDIDLPGNYSIVRTSAHQIKLAPKKGESSWGSDIIPAKIVEVAWDDNYILVKRLGLMTDPESNNGYQIPNAEKESFWILEIENGDLLGPLSEEGFEIQKDKLGISENVKLKKVEDLK